MKSLRKALGALDAEAAASLVAAASDIALIVDGDGIIEDVSVNSSDLSVDGMTSWPGRRWSEIVTVESRPKVEEMLREAIGRRATKGRQVNHPSQSGADVPIRYSALRVGRNGRVLALGSDLRTVAALQRRLVDAQQSMEREYAKLRNAETRYRLLFRLTAEPVFILDATTQKIVEANPAACESVGRPLKKLTGRRLEELFADAESSGIQTFLSAAQVTGSAEDIRVAMTASGKEVRLSASLFRQEGASFLLVRSTNQTPGYQVGSAGDPGARLSAIMERFPDGFVVAGLDLTVLAANAAFLDLAQLATEEQAKGNSLRMWLGRTESELDVLLTNVREHGSVRLFASAVRGEFGAVEPVEVSAVAVPHGSSHCFGFSIRSVSIASTARSSASDRQLPRSMKEMTELVGRVPLKTLVRETADIIERLCIEAALELARDNRVSAAEMLGLSRQGLYSKLRRYGIGELPADAD